MSKAVVKPVNNTVGKTGDKTTTKDTQSPQAKGLKRSHGALQEHAVKLWPNALVPETQWSMLGKACMVSSRAVRLRQWPTYADDMPSREDMSERVSQLSNQLDTLLTCLYAQGKHQLLMILQGVDSSGKDGVARGIMRAVHPMALRMVSFKVPNAQESGHDFLWRIHPHVPGKGQSVIFNRSHYDAAVVPMVQGTLTPAEVEVRCRQINDFERMLVESGTTVLKVFLNLSREEQKKRMLERWEHPEKRWKLTPADVNAQEHYSLYANAYETVLEKTCTAHAPWWIVPADHKGFRNMLTAEILAGTLERMGLEWPEPDPSVLASGFWKELAP